MIFECFDMIMRPRFFGLALVATMAMMSNPAFAQETPASDRAETAAPEPSTAQPTSKPRVKAPPPKPAAPKPVAQAVTPALTAPTPAPAAQLPNGASSITEDYGDWTVRCRIENGQKLCVLSQAQGNRQTGQRMFAIELITPKDGKTDGTILMPFGLKLEAGATLKLDDKALGQGVRFSTCVPDGCLLPVSFPTIATDAMKTAKTLSVASLNLGNGEAVTFNVSLNGFGQALARVVELGK